jgi:hypothetical protein
MCRRCESLGTDSRVLRRERPFNTSINAFGAKFFSQREVGRAGAVVREKISREISLPHRLFSP